MDHHALKLQKYIQEHKVECKLHWFEADCSHSDSCTQVLGVGLDGIIKTILMLSDQGKVLALILRGDGKIDRKVLKEQFQSKDFILASKEQILGISSYPLGGVPPFGFAAEFLIDSLLMQERKKEFYAGGGSTQSLVKITPAEIQRQTKAKELAFSKPNSS